MMAANKHPFRHLFGSALLLGTATAGLVALAPSTAYAVDNGASSIVSLEQAQSNGAYTGWARSNESGEMYWFSDGEMYRNKELYDAETESWYYFQEDGTMAHDKEVWLSELNKWVRYDEQGHMIHGVFVEDRGTYYFDEWTGEMLHGEAELSLEHYGNYGTGWFYFDTWTGVMAIDEDVYLPTDDGGKWVRYDTDGTMVHGEDQRVSKADGQVHWWYFDTMTGAMQKGLTTITTSDGTEKTVLYDETFGWMLYGTQEVDGVRLTFDEVTGALLDTANVNSNEIVRIALSKLGAPYQHAGLGPNAFSCDGFTAWVYDQAGVKVYESRVDSSFNAQSEYIRDHGGMVTSIDELEPGDILFFGSSWNNLRHAAIYLGVEDGTPKMIHAAGHTVNGVRIGVTIGPLDRDFLGGGHPHY